MFFDQWPVVIFKFLGKGVMIIFLILATLGFYCLVLPWAAALAWMFGLTRTPVGNKVESH